jgi:hypothetical protein
MDKTRIEIEQNRSRISIQHLADHGALGDVILDMYLLAAPVHEYRVTGELIPGRMVLSLYTCGSLVV